MLRLVQCLHSIEMMRSQAKSNSEHLKLMCSVSMCQLILGSHAITMAPRRTSFNPKWKKDYSWIDSVSSDQFKAFCQFCNKPFSIAGKGEGCIKEHAATNKHIQAEKCVASSQSMIRFTIKGSFLFNVNNFYFT